MKFAFNKYRREAIGECDYSNNYTQEGNYPIEPRDVLRYTLRYV